MKLIYSDKDQKTIDKIELILKNYESMLIKKINKFDPDGYQTLKLFSEDSTRALILEDIVKLKSILLPVKVIIKKEDYQYTGVL